MLHQLRVPVLILISAWLLAACSSELPLPGASGEQKIVLLGELSAGDTALIRAGQSTRLGTDQQLINGLNLVLRKEGGAPIALQSVEDVLSFSLFTLPYSSPERISAGSRYTVEGSHPELGNVSATVNVPGPFTASLTSMEPVDYNGEAVLRFDIAVNDPNAANAYYVIEAVKQLVAIYGYFYFNGMEYSIVDSKQLYDSLKAENVPVSERYDTSYSGSFSRQAMYTTDAMAEQSGGSSAGRLFGRVFLPGKSFGGATHHTRVLLPRNTLSGEFGQQAQTILYVKSVAKEYYDYLKSYDQYDPWMGLGGNATPGKLEGNVTGGFGMVGGVSKWSVAVIY